MKKLKYLVIPCFLLLIQEKTHAQIPAQTIPAFSFSSSGKDPFTNKDLARDKPLFFVFVDPECEHCQRAMRAIAANYKDFRKAALYIVSLESREKLGTFINTYGPILKDKKNVILLQDKESQFIVRFKPRRYPAMMLYSPEGKLIDYEDNPESVFRFLKPLGANGK